MIGAVPMRETGGSVWKLNLELFVVVPHRYMWGALNIFLFYVGEWVAMMFMLY